MTEYIVGLRLGKRSEVLTIEAEDALIAAPFGNPIGGAIVAIRIGRNEDCEARRPMSASGHETDMPKYLGDVRCWVNSGKHLLASSFSGFDHNFLTRSFG
jgi:hypothetical protein